MEGIHKLLVCLQYGNVYYIGSSYTAYPSKSVIYKPDSGVLAYNVSTWHAEGGLSGQCQPRRHSKTLSKTNVELIESGFKQAKIPEDQQYRHIYFELSKLKYI